MNVTHEELSDMLYCLCTARRTVVQHIHFKLREYNAYSLPKRVKILLRWFIRLSLTHVKYTLRLRKVSK